MRRRLDQEMVRRGLAATRSQAREAIAAGRVTVGGSPAAKPGSMVAPADPIAMAGEGPAFVSRAGAKLDAALDRFGVDPGGRLCLDAGAGTGGFTDALLQRGAARVVAVDVGYGQFAWRLRSDPRVTLLERFNVRRLRPADLPGPPEVVTADLSFISLVKVLDALAGVAAEEADLVLLVKPQFEAGRGAVGKGGVVRDPAVWRATIERVAEACRDRGVAPRGVMASPVRGPAGNVEFLLHAVKGGPTGPFDPGEALREVART